MDRLTHENFSCMAEFCTETDCQLYDGCPALDRYNRLKAYEDTGLTPEEIGNAVAELAWVKGQLDNIVQKFGLYHDGRDDAIIELLKMGSERRLLPLPAPIGSTVYVLGHRFRAGKDECWINPGKFRPSDLEKIGERVFFTYEEAKAHIFAKNKDNPRFWFIEMGGADG